MRMQRGYGVVYRHGGMVVFVVVTHLTLLPFAISGAFRAKQQPGIIPAIIVLAGLLWWFWAVGWLSKVIIGPTGITLDNGFIRRFIPWDLFADVTAGNSGIEFVLRDGTRYRCVAYGAFALAVSPYRSKVKIRRQLLAACRQYGYLQYQNQPNQNQPVQQYRPDQLRQVKVAWWPLPFYIVPFEVIAIASLFGSGQ
jgi:hypothetical protein